MPLRSKNQSDISIMRKLCYTWHSKIWRHIIMIAYISGALVSAGENYIVIDNHGMGYRIFVSGKFLEHIPAYGTQIKIYTHMYIREDELTLYGFHSEEELSVFRILIGISGVGPKVAMAILTALTIQELQLAVISEDTKTISKANGVGAKGASRIILELKDKLSLEEAFEQKLANEQAGAAAAATGAGMTDAKQEAVEALVALGYSSTDALRAVRKVTDAEAADVESILKLL